MTRNNANALNIAKSILKYFNLFWGYFETFNSKISYHAVIMLSRFLFSSNEFIIHLYYLRFRTRKILYTHKSALFSCRRVSINIFFTRPFRLNINSFLPSLGRRYHILKTDIHPANYTDVIVAPSTTRPRERGR